MANVWERFNNIAKAEEVIEAQGRFDKIAEGEYDVTLIKIEPSFSKKGSPMVKGRFQTDDGKFIFYNQMLESVNPEFTPVNIAEANAFINDLTGEDITFTSIGDFADRIEKIQPGIKTKVKVEYTGKKKDWLKLTIVKELTEDDLFEEVDDDLVFDA